MRSGARRRTMLATVVAGMLLAPAVGAETLQDAWERASQHDQGLAAVRSEAEAAQLDAAAARAQRMPTLAVGGAWIAPSFTTDRAGRKFTDFNDLHHLEGLHVVRVQVETRLRQLGWGQASAAHEPEDPSSAFSLS